MGGNEAVAVQRRTHRRDDLGWWGVPGDGTVGSGPDRFLEIPHIELSQQRHDHELGVESPESADQIGVVRQADREQKAPASFVLGPCVRIADRERVEGRFLERATEPLAIGGNGVGNGNWRLHGRFRGSSSRWGSGNGAGESTLWPSGPAYQKFVNEPRNSRLPRRRFPSGFTALGSNAKVFAIRGRLSMIAGFTANWAGTARISVDPGGKGSNRRTKWRTPIGLSVRRTNPFEMQPSPVEFGAVEESDLNKCPDPSHSR